MKKIISRDLQSNKPDIVIYVRNVWLAGLRILQVNHVSFLVVCTL